ncbi:MULTISPECIES: hypothetical protein [unclassified Microbulbifer]|uniref:hypothetical protein n=1 Tax=unclassified Microbulbifer TaxID=2619833 RepID=UPI0027E4AE29|nr:MULTISPECIES: hypothetical protein [unclassified Microbulbifer]
MKDNDRPPIDSPEFEEWLRKKSAETSRKLFGENYKPADFETGGVICGDADSLYKTDAEQFPHELEEYTPEERRKNFKVHKGGPEEGSED